MADQLPFKRIAVIGAGSYGTALAIHLARRGLEVSLWGRDREHMAHMQAARENEKYLPDCNFPSTLTSRSDLEATVSGADHILIAVPSHALHAILRILKPLLSPDQGIISACKGLEQGTGALVHEIIEDVLGSDCKFAVLSGPTFAKEVGRGVPAGVTIASLNPEFAALVVAAFHYGGFRAYLSSDIVGVEIGGAVKNVMAICVGCADGLGLGANTRAILITRGLAEIMRLGEALGGKRETMMGLAGLGDLVLTCTDDQSRNRRMGLALAKGLTVEEAKIEIKQVVEGVRVAPEVQRLARKLEIEMPITDQVCAVLAGESDPLEALRTLGNRPSRVEAT